MPALVSNSPLEYKHLIIFCVFCAIECGSLDDSSLNTGKLERLDKTFQPRSQLSVCGGCKFGTRSKGRVEEELGKIFTSKTENSAGLNNHISTSFIRILADFYHDPNAPVRF